MEPTFFEVIALELEQEVEGKEKWLKDVSDRITNLSSEISKVSEITESNAYKGLFISYKKTADHISTLSQLFSLPSFISDFCINLKKMNDRKLVNPT